MQSEPRLALTDLELSGVSLKSPSVAVVLLNGALGMAATLLWWERADQTV